MPTVSASSKSNRFIGLALFAVLIATAVLWSGLRYVDFNPLQYFEALGPIASLHDAFRPFTSFDPNLIFYRPVPNFTLMVEFLLFHWNGPAYHLMNLVYHILATFTVYFFVRSSFRLTQVEAIATALLFGVLASHDTNLTTDMMRTDTLVSLFLMLTFVADRRATEQHNLLWKIIALLCFAIAVLSKELAFLVIPLIPWFSTQTLRFPRFRTYLTGLAPYICVAILGLILHSYYTIPFESPLRILKPTVFLEAVKNAVLGFAYIVLPLKAETAFAVFAKHVTAAAIAGFLALLSVALLLRRTATKSDLLRIVKPVALFIFSTLPIVGFGRWRFYLPSVAVLAMIVMMASVVASHGRIAKYAVAVVLIAFTVFHITSVLAVQQEWKISTGMMHSIHDQLVSLLGRVPQRPLTLAFITSPSKLGGGTILPVGQAELTRRAEADRLGGRAVAIDDVKQAHVGAWAAVDVFGLDPEHGFAGLRTTRISADDFAVEASDGSPVIMMPTESGLRGISSLHLNFNPGDTVMSRYCICTVTRVLDGAPKSIRVHVVDTSAYPIYFNGSGISTFN